MTDQSDWRVDNAASLRGAKLRFQKYSRWSETWDHDHCAAFWATFAEIKGDDYLNEGYATCEDDPRGAGYEWVCAQCFQELKSLLNWYDEKAVEIEP